MKRLLLIILTASGTFMAACFKDTGNYDYKDINEISITGIAANYNAVFNRDVLHIEPIIKMTEANADASRFNYYWILVKGTTVVDTVGRKQVLDYTVNASPDTYVLTLRIVDNATGLAWKKSSSLTVGTNYSSGLMLIGTAESGAAEVEMISMGNDTTIMHGILASSGLPTLYDPVTVLHTGTRDTNSNYARVWVMTKSGSYYLDRKTMTGNTYRKFSTIIAISENLDKENLNPILLAPQIRDRAGNTGNTYSRAMMTSEGHIFPTSTFLNGGDFYTNPINRAESNFDHLIKPAPYLLYSIGNMNSVMWYDTENNRFMNYANFGLGLFSTIPSDLPGDVFSWNQAATGRTLVYGENTRNTDGGSTNGNSFTIMKDAAGNHYIYKFYASTATPLKRDMYTVLPIATSFAQADFYAFSSRRSVVFYSVGNTLYAYDYNKGFEKAYIFPEVSGDEITMLKFDTQIDHTTNALYIATYDAGTKGRLRRFMVGTDPNTVTISPVDRSDWNGLIRIKDMNWRAVN